MTLLLVAWFGPTQKAKAQTNTENASTETKKDNFYYTCPMHPEVHTDHPGNCPG